MTYPPPYNPALTLNSRRFYALSPRPRTAEAASTRPLDTSHGPAEPERVLSEQNAQRPHTASSTFSNPASSAHGDADRGGSSGARGFGDRSSVDDATLVASETCTECVRETRSSNTYLVEVINYPALQLARERAHVHGKAEYDAVLLVYDVASRRSFEAVKALHSEIPVCTRKNHHHHRRAAGHSNTARNRTSAWFGGGANDTGSTGSGEIVVAVVGNKSDFDAEYASVELGLDGPLLDKEAEMQGADVEQRGLVHPLYRESRFYGELNLQGEPPSAAALETTELGPPETDGLGPIEPAGDEGKERPRSLPYGKGGYLPVIVTRNDKSEDIEKWLRGGKPLGGADDAVDLGRVGTNETDATTAARRQVSRLDGEALVRSLMLQVPFHETSAKTGENVEEVFDAMIREVLREMGREAHGPIGKNCRHRPPPKNKHAKAARPPDVDPAGRVEDAAEAEAADGVTAEAPAGIAVEGVPPPKRLKRRQSVIDRMRRVFMRKQLPVARDIAV